MLFPPKQNKRAGVKMIVQQIIARDFDRFVVEYREWIVLKKTSVATHYQWNLDVHEHWGSYHLIIKA